jgi:hypothetical protein
MLKRVIEVLGTGLALTCGMIAHAPAGSCAGPDCGCGPAVAVAAVPCVPLVESYLVNQGPVYSGPGHYLRQTPDPEPCCYPSVGYVYSGYPYGVYDSGGYPRGFYSPYAGYPYAETYPYRRYAHWRQRSYHRVYRPTAMPYPRVPPGRFR